VKSSQFQTKKLVETLFSSAAHFGDAVAATIVPDEPVF
jgi:hypothetical protein